MPKNAMVIPVHMPKVNWLTSFLNSLIAKNALNSKINFDIILVASNYDDYRSFNRINFASPSLIDIKVLNAENYIVDSLNFKKFPDLYRANHNFGIVNFKKYIGLHWAASRNYDLVACVDSDTVVVRSTEFLFDSIERNYEKAFYIGSKTDQLPLLNIVSASMKMLSPEDQDLLEEKIYGGSLYHWFSDIPAYRGSDLNQFFEYMSQHHESLEGFFSNLSWHSFDHLVYSYWRCAHKGARMIDGSQFEFPIPEALNYYHVLRIKDRFGYEPAWLPSREIFYQQDILTEFQSVCLGYHFDRL